MDMVERERVGTTVLQAYTLDECLRAEKLLLKWLRDHPEDAGMYELVRMLATVKAAALEDGKVPHKPGEAATAA